MRGLLSGLLIASAIAGCSRDRSRQEGLPPATEWKQDPNGAMVQMSKQGELPPPPPGMAGGAGANPHGAMGGNPHAGMGGGGDPHAGLGIDPTDPSDPHAGLDMTGGGASSVPPIPGPDPNRAIDPTRYVKGVIKIHEKARARAKAGLPVFIVVKRVDATGAATGMPLAVDKLTWNNGDLAFELTENQAMVAGTELTGEVMVNARVDQDGDASSKEPGDVTGQVRVKLPADNVQIVLDTIL